MTFEDSPRHQLNNVLAKIVASAELALLSTQDPQVRAELDLIASLVEQAGRIVDGLPDTLASDLGRP